MKKYLVAGVLLLAGSLLPALAVAADNVADAAATQRAAYLQSFLHGVSIHSNKQIYQMLDGIRAVQRRPPENAEQAVARVGGGMIIETKGPYVIYSAAPPPDATAATHQTAYNPRTGVIGIVPGTLIVKLHGSAAASGLASEYGLAVERLFPQLQTAILKINPGRDVVSALAAVASDARVRQAEIEVLEHLDQPN